MVHGWVQAIKRQLENHIFYLALAIISGIAIRFYGLEIQSLWLDELYSVVTALSEDTSQLYERLVRDPHPPLYQLFLFYWVRLFGDSEIAVRLPSALAGSLTIIITYYGVKEFWSKHIATSTAIFVSLTYAGIYFSQEARAYSFLMLLSTISFVLWLRLLGNGAIHHKGVLGKYIITIVLLSYLHYFGLMLVVFQLAYLFFCAFYYKKPATYLFAATGCLFLAYLPWLSVMISTLTAGPIWIPKPDMFFFFQFAAILLYPTISTSIILLLLIACVLIDRNTFTRNVQRMLGEKIQFDLPIPALLLLSVSMTLFSFLFSLYLPVLTPKNLLVLAPVGYLYLSFWIANIPFLGKARQNAAVFMICIISFLLFAPIYYSPHKEQWREAVGYALDNAEEGSLIVLAKPASRYFDYYVRRLGGYEKGLSIIEAELYDYNSYLDYSRETGSRTLFVLLAHWRYVNEGEVIGMIKEQADAYAVQSYEGAKVHLFSLQESSSKLE